jgi:hypothetical protein
MAYAENRIDGRKDRRSDSKTETGKSSAGKADGTLNFALTAGAVGLGIALLEREQATAANAASAATFSLDSERLSDASAAIAQAKDGIGQSAIAGHAVHDSGNGVPSAVSEAQIDPQTTSPADSESLVERSQQQPEAAEQMAARDDNNTVDSVHDAIVPAVALPAGGAAKSVSTAGAGGAIEEAHNRSSLAGSGQPGVDIMPGDTPAERTVEAVRDIASDLLGSDGLIGVVPAITNVVGNLVGEDGALDGLTDIDGNILDGLVGEDGVLGVLTEGDGNVLDGLVDEDGVLGGLISNSDGAILGSLGGNAGGVLDALVNEQNVLGLTNDGGILGDLDGNVEAVLDDDGAILGDLSGGGETVVDDLVGEDSILGSVADSGEGVLGGLIGDGGLLGSSNVPEEATAGTDTAAASSDIASTEEPVETVAQTEPAPTNASAEMPSNIFDVANAALQITEYVADALTPTLAFVGQPIIETDAHADTDNSSITLAHHAA